LGLAGAVRLVARLALLLVQHLAALDQRYRLGGRRTAEGQRPDGRAERDEGAGRPEQPERPRPPGHRT
jgi:hypothetical protein